MTSLPATSPQKRKRENSKDLCSTHAAEFNRKVFRRLQRALETNPEVDLSTVLPSDYANRLVQQSCPSELPKAQITSHDSQTPQVDNPCKQPNDHEDDLEVPFGLARDLEQLLRQEGQPTNTTTALDLASGVQNASWTGTVLWKSEAASNNMVIKCNDEIAVKIIPRTSDYTEFTGLQHLQANLPEVPGPKPLGVISAGRLTYLFMTYIPGVSLDTVWQNLDMRKKRFLCSQLDAILDKMRQWNFTSGSALGGVGGEGCKDARRHTRICNHPIFDAAGFVDFLFSNPHFGGSIYIEFLRRLWPTQSTSIVFTHGDLQPSNIMVEEKDDGYYHVTGLVDWERSGFYPDWVECVKATNDLSKTESESDWSLLLPACISPGRYPECWLLDRLWDAHIA